MTPDDVLRPTVDAGLGVPMLRLSDALLGPPDRAAETALLLGGNPRCVCEAPFEPRSKFVGRFVVLVRCSRCGGYAALRKEDST